MVNHMSESTFSLIADFGDICGESPIWDAKRSTLFWTDIGGREVRSCSWPDRRCQTISSGFEVCGFALREDGGFAVANGAGFWLWDVHSEPVLVPDTTGGLAKGLNDCVADPEGGFLAGSCFYNPETPDYPRGHLIRVGVDGAMTVLDEGYLLANGLGFSLDGGTLYAADSAARRIYVYDYNAREGVARNRRVFVQVPCDEGIPDGLTVDEEGFVWSAQWFGSGIVRYDPDGAVERRVYVPAPQSSSLAFGGADLTDIFVTSAAVLDAVPLAQPGFDRSQVSYGGGLFHANLGIPGRLEYVCKIRPNAGNPATPGKPRKA